MERLSVMCVLLLLLLSPSSGAELQDMQILEQGVRPEVLNVPEQTQTCPSDVHAVLRDMSAKLAKLEVRIEHLQTHNQDLNSKLAKSEVGIQELQNLNQAQAAELRSLKTRVNVTENQVQSLSRDRAVGQVAFSASLRASSSGYEGPFNTHSSLIFRHVVTNIGNGYSSNTGLFTAPVRGAYHFEFYVISHGSPGVAAVLVKNGEHVFAAIENPPSSWGTATNGATLLLEAGDVVFLRLWEGHRTFDNENHHSTFSGHLLFPM